MLCVLDMLSTLCIVKADHSTIRAGIRKGKAPNGARFFFFLFDFVLYFGGPELKAQINWKENVCNHFFSWLSNTRTDCSPRVWLQGVDKW